MARATGIPVERLSAGEGARLLHAEEELSRRVVGQARAVSAVASALRIARAGLTAEHRLDNGIVDLCRERAMADLT